MHTLSVKREGHVISDGVFHCGIHPCVTKLVVQKAASCMSSCTQPIQFDLASLKPLSRSYTCPSLLPMECPICMTKRYSSDWKPSQWNSESPKNFEFNCCKRCASDGYLVAPGELMHCWEQMNICMGALRTSGIEWIPLFEKYM